MAKTTMRDIAREAGVSRPAVSYVLNGRHQGLVSPVTSRRIHELADAMGYVPNRTARALATGRSNLILVWTFGIADAYYARVLGQVLGLLRAQHYDAHFCETEDNFTDRHVLRDTDTSPADGVIALDSPECVRSYLHARGSRRKPMVNMGGSIVSEVDHVGLDLAAGARDATRHLIAGGRVRIAYLAPAVAQRPGDARFNGYTEAMREAGLMAEYAKTSQAAGMRRADTRHAVREHVRRHGCPDAFFCYNDDGAIGAYRGLRDLGLRIPHDVALVGCNGDPDTEYLDVPISTLVCPLKEMCAKAWSFLRNRMAQPDLPRQAAVLGLRLVVRESSDGVSYAEAKLKQARGAKSRKEAKP